MIYSHWYGNVYFLQGQDFLCSYIFHSVNTSGSEPYTSSINMPQRTNKVDFFCRIIYNLGTRLDNFPI